MGGSGGVCVTPLSLAVVEESVGAWTVELLQTVEQERERER